MLDCCIVAQTLLPFLLQPEPVPGVLQSVLLIPGLPVAILFPYQTKFVCFQRLSTTGASAVQLVSYIPTAHPYVPEAEFPRGPFYREYCRPSRYPLVSWIIRFLHPPVLGPLRFAGPCHRARAETSYPPHIGAVYLGFATRLVPAPLLSRHFLLAAVVVPPRGRPP